MSCDSITTYYPNNGTSFEVSPFVYMHAPCGFEAATIPMSLGLEDTTEMEEPAPNIMSIDTDEEAAMSLDMEESAVIAMSLDMEEAPTDTTDPAYCRIIIAALES